MSGVLGLAPHVLTTIAVCFVANFSRRGLPRALLAALMRLLLGGIVFLVVLQPLALYPPSVAGYAAKAIVVYLLARAFQWALVIYLFDRPEKRPAHVLYLVTLGIGSDFLSDLALPLFVDWFHKAMSHSSFIV